MGNQTSKKEEKVAIPKRDETYLPTSTKKTVLAPKKLPEAQPSKKTVLAPQNLPQPYDRGIRTIDEAETEALLDRLAKSRGADRPWPSRTLPLITAAERGSMKDIEKLISEGADVNQLGWDIMRLSRVTPLMMAIKIGLNKEEKIPYLLEHGADPNIEDSNGLNALHYAAAYMPTNMDDYTKMLVERMSIDSINKKGDQIIMMGQIIKNVTPLDIFYVRRTKGLIDFIRSKGGKANWYDENGNGVGEGNGDLNADNLPSFQRETSMKF